jgi:hypothetical protein
MTQNLKELKRVLANIKAEYTKIPSPEPLAIITANIEEYRILKQAEDISADFKILADNAAFITDYMKPIKVKEEKIRGKRILMQKSNSFFYGDNIPQKARQLFICGKGQFFVELVEEANSAGLLAYCPLKGQENIKKTMARTLAKKRADILIVQSCADETFYKEILKKYYPHTTVLNIVSCAEFFDER